MKWFKDKEKIPNFKECPYCKNGHLGLKTGETVLYDHHFYVDFTCFDCSRRFYVKLKGPAKMPYREI